LVLETVAGQAEALTNPRIERVARTLARQFVNTGVDCTQETSWAGLEQKPPARANRFGDVLRPRWTVPPAEQKDRTAVTRTRRILLARTAKGVLLRELNAMNSSRYARDLSRVCPSSQRVSIIRAHAAC
jgi:hypothetical protein